MSHASRIAAAIDAAEARSDLLSAVDEARAELEAATAAWQMAQRKYLYAPQGQRNTRLNALLEANKRALRAEGDLKRAEREAGLK